MNKLVLTFIFTGLAVVFSMCSYSTKKDTAPTAQTNAADTTVAVRIIQPTGLDDYIEFGGTVEAVDTVAVLPSVAGKIARILVEAGDKVSRNQIIAQVDASKPGADFTMSPVRASAAGTVTAIPVSLGAYVTASSTVAEIASIDDLEIKVNVSERFVPLVRLNQTGEVTFKSYPDERFEATIAKLSPILDPATRTMQVTLKLAETKNIVKAGMFAHVRLVTDHKEQILAVPTRAIVYNSGKPFVFIAEKAGESNGTGADTEVTTVHRLSVQTGISVDGTTEITAGLSTGDRVVVKGQNMVSDGQAVNVVGE